MILCFSKKISFGLQLSLPELVNIEIGKVHAVFMLLCANLLTEPLSLHIMLNLLVLSESPPRLVPWL